MRDPVSTSALPDTLSARLAALRGAPPPSASERASSVPPTSASEGKDSAEDLAARLARLHTPSKRDVERGVPVGMKGVGLEGALHTKGKEDEVERFLREAAAQEETEKRAQALEDDADDLIRSILSAPPAPSDPTPSLPSPPSSAPSSPPLARARRSIPALSPSLLDTLSGVEVQFFRPGLAAGADVGVGGHEEEEEELMRRAGDEAALEGRVQAREGAADATRGWEARLAGLGGVAPSASSSIARSAGMVPVLGSAPAPEGVEEVRRALRRRERRRSRKGGEGAEEGSSDDEESETSEEEEETESEASSEEGSGEER